MIASPPFTRGFSRALVPLFLGGMILVQGILLGLWLRRDTRPPAWDQSVHLMSAWRYKEAAAHGNIGALLHTRTSPGHPPYPPAVHYLMGAGLSLAESLGWSVEDGAVFVSQLFFLGLLILGSYVLAAHFWGPPSGLAAAALASFAPPVQSMAHQPLADLGLVATVVFSYALWVRSDGFTRFRWSLGLGVALGVGCLTKWTFPTYILPIFGSAVYRFFRNKNARNILWAGGIAVLLVVPWYLINLPILLPKLIRVAGLGAQEGDPSGTTLAGWFWYGRSTWTFWGGPLVLGGLAGVAWGFFRRMKSAPILIAWFLISYGVWSLVSNKDPRYLAPAAVVLPIAWAALPFRLPHLGALLTALWATWAVFSSQPRPWMDRPVTESWPIEDIVHKAVSLQEERAGPSVLTLVANHEALNGPTLTWTVLKEGASPGLVVRTKLVRLGQLTEFVLVKTGSLGPAGTATDQEVAREEIFIPQGWFPRAFAEVDRWAFPDGSDAVLFQRRKGAPRSSSAVGLLGLLPDLVPNLALEGLRVSIEESRTFPGEFEVQVVADEFRLMNLFLRQVDLVLDGVQMASDDAGRLRLLGLRRVDVRSAFLTEEDASAFLSKKVPALRAGHIAFLEGNRIRVTGSYGPVPVRAEISFSLGGSESQGTEISVELVQLRLVGVPVPVWALGPLRHRDLSLLPTGRMPYEIGLEGLRSAPATERRGRALEIYSDRP